MKQIGHCGIQYNNYEINLLFYFCIIHELTNIWVLGRTIDVKAVYEHFQNIDFNTRPHGPTITSV